MAASEAAAGEDPGAELASAFAALLLGFLPFGVALLVSTFWPRLTRDRQVNIAFRDLANRLSAFVSEGSNGFGGLACKRWACACKAAYPSARWDPWARAAFAAIFTTFARERDEAPGETWAFEPQGAVRTRCYRLGLARRVWDANDQDLEFTCCIHASFSAEGFAEAPLSCTARERACHLRPKFSRPTPAISRAQEGVGNVFKVEVNDNVSRPLSNRPGETWGPAVAIADPPHLLSTASADRSCSAFQMRPSATGSRPMGLTCSRSSSCRWAALWSRRGRSPARACMRWVRRA